uniref:NAB domain-containing protein n=1 Tax=Aegilops tauschii subsp. strangulata TaxID=200361 RepID=A0A453E3G2_AEGTS
MKRMSRMPTRKAHSWWWDSHISPKNNKWLADNLEEMDKQVKEMLKLIEDEGDSFAKKAEMYYQRRPLLVTHVENFYRMYRALAERYDNVTGELRKNMPSSLKSQGSGISESDSEAQSTPASPESEKKTSKQKGKKGSDGSSSSSSSDSDSEVDEVNQENGNGITHALNERVIELEDELKEAMEKLEALEEKNMRCQCENLEENIKGISSEKEDLEAAVLENKNKFEELKGEMALAAKHHEAQLSYRDLEIEKCKRELEQVSERYTYDKSTLETEIRELQEVVQNLEGNLAKLSEEKLQLEAQVMELEQTSHSLDDSSAEIKKLQKVIKDLQARLENDSNEKRVLEERAIEFEQVHRELEDSRAETVELQTRIEKLKADLEGALQEKLMLEGCVKDLEHSIAKLSEANASLEDKLSSTEAQLKQLHAEKAEASAESEKLISGLKQDIANLKTELEVLSSQKAVVDNKVSGLLSDLATCDEKMKEMDSHLHQLHLEHVQVIAEADAARKSVADLRARVRELEEEVEKQKLMAFDSAEGKREAIRQLCFSLEHYRDGYQQLRQVLQGHKRPMVMAT